MRTGVAVSVIGHIGAVMITMMAWQTTTTLVPSGGSVVPVEIVNIAEDSNVRALAIETPEAETTAAEEEPTEAQTAPTPAPSPTQRRQQPNDDFNLAEIEAGLINREKSPSPRRNRGETSNRNQQGSGLGTAEQVRLQDRGAALIRAHMRRCWRMPADLPEPERLVVQLEFELNRNGTLMGQPRLVSPSRASLTFDAPMREAVNRAERAVRQCDPYPLADDPIVGEHYDLWRTQIYTFGEQRPQGR